MKVGTIEVSVRIIGAELLEASLSAVSGSLDESKPAWERALERSALRALCEVARLSDKARQDLGIYKEPDIRASLSVDLKGESSNDLHCSVET